MEPGPKPTPPAAQHPITVKYLSLGGSSSFLGSPTSEIGPTASGRGQVQFYQRGAIYWSEETGAHPTHGAVGEKYQALEAESSFLRLPTADETPAADGVGAYQRFQGGSIYWHPDFGAHEVHGGIGRRYVELRGEAGPLGYPVTDELPAPGGAQSRYSLFQRGAITYSPERDVQVFPYTFLPD